ncbi:hypothetical protein [Aquimarina sp. MAR_2010_214]|uniref:hypothetical protein n=1 Tax=Aquimarina sp. MAR_2010_214 TaxID=1250026 RepID=UPI0011780065|nr:hypothetical protein [Aquimarina sp. MAR_2010_214]
MDLTETYPTGYRSGQNNGSDYYYQREGQRELHRRMHQFGQVQGQEYYKERNLALTPENTKKVKQALVQYRPVQRSSDKETKEKNHEQGMDI